MGKDTKHFIENGGLTVDCLECSRDPDLASSECVRCVISGMNGSEVNSIVLRTLKDRKYTGRMVSVMNGLCMMDSSARSAMKWNSRGKCSGCSCSPNSIINIAWRTFPSPDLDSARSCINEYESQDSRCGNCMASTYRMLDHLEYCISGVRQDTVSTGAFQ